MAIDSVNSAAPIITGATIGAAVGGAATWKGAPVVAKKFAQAQDTFVKQAVDNFIQKHKDGCNALTQKGVNENLKKLTDGTVKNDAVKEFIGQHKILNKVVEFTKTHKKSTITIGAVAVGLIGGLIGKVIADKKAE